MTTKLMPWRRKTSNSIQKHVSPFDALHRQIDDLFEDFFDQTGGAWPTLKRSNEAVDWFNPQFDVSESDSEILVTADLPGMSEEDIDVTLDEGRLVVRGEKHVDEEKKDKKRNTYVSERHYGQFMRVFPLPKEIQTDKVNASFKKGVLRVEIPKTEDAAQKSKRIEIHGS